MHPAPEAAGPILVQRSAATPIDALCDRAIAALGRFVLCVLALNLEEHRQMRALDALLQDTGGEGGHG